MGLPGGDGGAGRRPGPLRPSLRPRSQRTSARRLASPLRRVDRQPNVARGGGGVRKSIPAGAGAERRVRAWGGRRSGGDGHCLGADERRARGEGAACRGPGHQDARRAPRARAWRENRGAPTRRITSDELHARVERGASIMEAMCHIRVTRACGGTASSPIRPDALSPFASSARVWREGACDGGPQYEAGRASRARVGRKRARNWPGL